MKAFALGPQLQTHTYQLNLLLSLTAFMFGRALKINHRVGFEFRSDYCINPHDTFSWGAASPPHCTLQGDRFPVTFTANLKADGVPGTDLLSGYPRTVCIWPWAFLLAGSECLEYPGTGRHYITCPSFPTSHISLLLDM